MQQRESEDERRQTSESEGVHVEEDILQVFGNGSGWSRNSREYGWVYVYAYSAWLRKSGIMSVE
jgi:hypothetical protein